MNNSETQCDLVTNSIIKNELEHRHDLEKQEIQNSWKSCCLRVDKRALQYFVSMILLVSLIIASAIGLLLTQHTQVFSSLLSLCIGAILPNPRLDGN